MIQLLIIMLFVSIMINASEDGPLPGFETFNAYSINNYYHRSYKKLDNFTPHDLTHKLTDTAAKAAVTWSTKFITKVIKYYTDPKLISQIITDKSLNILSSEDMAKIGEKATKKTVEYLVNNGTTFLFDQAIRPLLPQINRLELQELEDKTIKPLKFLSDTYKTEQKRRKIVNNMRIEEYKEEDDHFCHL